MSVVSSAMGKLWLVLNLRYLNKFLQKETFKYEDLCIASVMFEKYDFMFKFDLKSGYHHVDIYPEQNTLALGGMTMMRCVTLCLWYYHLAYPQLAIVLLN